ncbi:MAG: hypothetical protein AVDCRST_MAG49-2929 [uncultured Thermomicrobiales bacterium]|uniref:Sigma-70 family RNA polymerase sigma factor n=1 Tax=uncultured Thermomicrobiales bacterium TaxID=1645740 RepID=A0A6J4URG3_9BACT|nr:MAG: hypothetical protein AVDCRST_MAG49-2929 [uncultured Thermomicrobiales bacterium]
MGAEQRSDADLVRAARAGDTASLGVLLERYRAPLYAVALRMLGHGPQAQDAVHDTFLIALRRLDSLHDPAAVGGWLRAVTRNVCLETVRGAPGPLPLDGLPAAGEPRSSDASMEERIDRLATRDWVWTALAALPETLRVTAMLRYFGSHPSYEEIAVVLGVPIGTVKSRLNQVKVKLAEALLATAGLDHSEAVHRREAAATYFAAAADEINRGRGYDLLVDAYADDPEMLLADGTVVRGRRYLIEELDGDLRAGMKMHLSHVSASKDITILDASFENPQDDPFRCPPATTQVHFQRDGRTERVRLYFAPRPDSEKEEEGKQAGQDVT